MATVKELEARIAALEAQVQMLAQQVVARPVPAIPIAAPAERPRPYHPWATGTFRYNTTNTVPDNDTLTWIQPDDSQVWGGLPPFGDQDDDPPALAVVR